MAQFRLDLCGEFRLARANGKAVPLPGRKAQALLAYLALSAGRAHSREHLATLLWGERQEEQARQSLRQVLSALRKTLGSSGAALRSEGDGVLLEAGVCQTDVAEIEAFVAAADAAELERAATLATEPLLRGFSTGEDGFDLWLTGERERLRNLGCSALERLADVHAKAGEPAAAIEAAQRLVAIDPLREAGQRTLMRLYAETGQRTASLRQFQLLVEALRRELNAEPEPETVQLHDQIRGGAIESAAKPNEIAAPLASGRNVSAPDPLLAFDVPPPLPDIPSVAVLPFENLSDDPQQQYFGDGIAEDIIVDLARISGLLVIARQASFTYRDKAVPFAQIGHDLGVRTILKGTVRRAGNRARITAQLVEAASGRHLWAERYDRNLADLFQVQDEITAAIVTELSVKLVTGEMGRPWRAAFQDPRLLDRFYQGVAQFHQFTPSSLTSAIELLQEVLHYEPNSVSVLSMLGATHIRIYTLGLDCSDAALDAASDLLARARVLAPEHPLILASSASLHLFHKEFETAMALSSRACVLGPNDELVWGVRAYICMYSGYPQAGLDALRHARRFRPVDRPLPLAFTANALRLLDRLDDSLVVAKRCTEKFPEFPFGYLHLAINYGLKDRWDEAGLAVTSYLRLVPAATIKSISNWAAYRDSNIRERYIEVLRRAGLPE